MSLNTILATTPLTSTNYVLKATGTTIGNSLIWDNGTNVGIGTSTPARKLTVVGTIAAILSDANDVQCALSATTTAVNIAATYGTTGSYLPLTFSTGSDERMRITSGGLVNILSDSTNTTFTSSGALAIKNAASEPFISWHSNTGTRLGFIQMQSAGTAYFSVQVAQALAFDTSGAEKMRITSGKDVLINTTAIRTSASGSNATLNIKGGIYFGDTNSESCTINNNDSMIFNIDADNSSTANFFRFATNTTLETGGTELMRITEGGNVGIGMTGYSDMRLVVRGVGTSSATFGLRIENSAASALFQVRNDGLIETTLGTGTVYSTAGALSVVSDMNLKIEDGYIDNALEKVLNLKPRYFLWKQESNLPTDLRQLGFYAQEVNASLGEEAANTPKENVSWGINDRAILAFLTKAIQEQQAQIEELQEQINELKNK